LPHAPQFCGSDAAFTHCEPQVVCPAAQIGPPPVPVGEVPTFPSQPSSGNASGAIASAASRERIEGFIATTFHNDLGTRCPMSVATPPKPSEIIGKD
jgi:hypothetical protein